MARRFHWVREATSQYLTAAVNIANHLASDRKHLGSLLVAKIGHDQRRRVYPFPAHSSALGHHSRLSRREPDMLSHPT